MDRRVQLQRAVKAALSVESLDDLTRKDLEETIALLSRTKRDLEERLKSLRPPKKRVTRRLQEKPCILDYCDTTPRDSIIAFFQRVEKAFSSKWPQRAELGDLVVALPAQISGLEERGQAAQRVIAAAIHLESRNATTSRICSIVVADAMETYITDRGLARTQIQQALRSLMAEFDAKNKKCLKGSRKAGEWLIDFFQGVPLGAIYMMGQHNTLWGNIIGTGYTSSIVLYCRSLTGFREHAHTLTPAACRAIRNWADGCAYDIKPDSSLGQLLQEQEQNSTWNLTATHKSRLFVNPETSRATSELDTLVAMEDVAPSDGPYTIDDDFASEIGSVFMSEAPQTSSPTSDSNRLETDPITPSPREQLTTYMAASNYGDEVSKSMSRITSRPTALQRLRADTRLDSNGHSFRVCRSPSPPRTFSIPERLFHDIAAYFGVCCPKMVFDVDEILLSSLGGVEFRNELCNDFDSFCYTATMLKHKGMGGDEFGSALSKACGLVEAILRAEHPRTLACFFEVFIHLVHTGLPDVARSLCTFVKEMSAKVNGKESPLGQISSLLDTIDEKSFADTLAQAWKCMTDMFDSVLGTTHRLAISVRLDHAKRTMCIQSEEGVLRHLLAQLEGTHTPSTPRVMLNLAHNLNKQARHQEAEKLAQQVWAILRTDELYAKRIAERIECLKAISQSRFIRGETMGAERTMREAIQLIGNHWGLRHSWAIEFMTVLEDWLRNWAREEDANGLRGEIAGWMPRDDIDT